MLNNEFINYLSRLNIAALSYGLYQSLGTILFVEDKELAAITKVENALELHDSENKYDRALAAYNLLSVYFDYNKLDSTSQLDLRFCEPGIILKALSNKVEVTTTSESIFLNSLKDKFLQGEFSMTTATKSFYEDNVVGHVIKILSKNE